MKNNQNPRDNAKPGQGGGQFPGKNKDQRDNQNKSPNRQDQNKDLDERDTNR